MSKIKIAVSPWGTRKTGMGDFISSLILISKEKRVQCQLTSPTGVVIEGDKETLLEILNELDNGSFNKLINGVSITMEFDGSAMIDLSQAEIEFLNREVVKRANSQDQRLKLTKKTA